MKGLWCTAEETGVEDLVAQVVLETLSMSYGQSTSLQAKLQNF